MKKDSGIRRQMNKAAARRRNNRYTESDVFHRVLRSGAFMKEHCMNTFDRIYPFLDRVVQAAHFVRVADSRAEIRNRGNVVFEELQRLADVITLETGSVKEVVRSWQALPLPIQGPVNQDGVGHQLMPGYAVPVGLANLPLEEPHPHGPQAADLIEEFDHEQEGGEPEVVNEEEYEPAEP